MEVKNPPKRQELSVQRPDQRMVPLLPALVVLPAWVRLKPTVEAVQPLTSRAQVWEPARVQLLTARNGPVMALEPVRQSALTPQA